MARNILLFDFDGVIVDSFKISLETSHLVHPELKLTAEDYRRHFNGNIYTALAGTLKITDNHIDSNDPWFQVYIPKLLALPPLSGIRQLLTELSSDMQIAIVSSSTNQAISNYLAAYDLTPTIKHIYGGDIHTNKVVKTHMALRTFKAQPHEALFITDTLGDLREAAHAGVKAVGVSWGFQAPEQLRLGEPITIVHSPAELKQAIRTWSADTQITPV